MQYVQVLLQQLRYAAAIQYITLKDNSTHITYEMQENKMCTDLVIIRVNIQLKGETFLIYFNMPYKEQCS